MENERKMKQMEEERKEKLKSMAEEMKEEKEKNSREQAEMERRYRELEKVRTLVLLTTTIRSLCVQCLSVAFRPYMRTKRHLASILPI
jgi:RNase P subunit RPR2